MQHPSTSFTSAAARDVERSTHAAAPGLLSAFDACVASIIFLAPLFMGGRGPFGKFVFVSLVSAAAIVWASRQWLTNQTRWRWSGVEWLLAAGLALVTLQLVPLPQGLLLRISPSIAELLPMFVSPGEAAAPLGQWHTISLSPEATRAGLVVYLAYAVLFLLVVQRTESLNDVERLLRWVALAAIGMALLGLLQFLLGNGKFVWLYEHPHRTPSGPVKGSFQNQNHFAHFLALGIGPLIWWLWKVGHTARPTDEHSHVAGLGAGSKLSPDALKVMLSIGLGLVALAGALTFSRGGVIAMALAAIACLAVYYWQKLLGKRSLYGVGAMVFVIGAALFIHGYEPLARRLATLSDSRSLDELSQGRAALWSALMDGIPQFALIGSGIGSHRDVYPIFMEEYFSVEFTHGESGYLPLLLEAGVPGLLLMLIGIGICILWIARVLLSAAPPSTAARNGGSRSDGSLPFRAAALPCAAAIFASILASVVHSIGDFVWYLSACMSLTVILVACACRLSQLVADDSRDIQDQPSKALLQRILRPQTARITRLPSSVATALALFIAVLALAMTHDRLPAALATETWEQYRRLSATHKAELNNNDPLASEVLHRLTTQLERTLEANPDMPRAHLRLGAILLRQFDLQQRLSPNPMNLANIRDAALASQFPSRESQYAWLTQAVGENVQLLDRALRHCRAAVRACPLQGEAYIWLAELSFLEGPEASAKLAYVEQAKRVRPHHGRVLFAVGKEAAAVLDLAGAIENWKRAFQQDPELQGQIVDSLAHYIPAQFFLDSFEPNLTGMGAMFAKYRQINRFDEARIVARDYVQVLQGEARLAHPEQASHLFHRAQVVYSFLGEQDQALACQQKAVDMTPNDLNKRVELAVLLVASGQYSAAIEQFRWCLRRRPNDAALTSQLLAAKRKLLEQQAAAARPADPATSTR